MERITLTNPDGRAKAMTQHVEAVAESILTDHTGDTIFAKYMQVKRHVHRYSLGNLMLQMWQAPESSLVASRTAFGKMAEAQGHAGKDRTSKRGKSWKEYVFLVAGCRAVWIWSAPCHNTFTKQEVNRATGEVEDVLHSFSRCLPDDVYCVEDVRYCDTGEPFVLPTFVTPIHDEGLFDALLAFAAAEGITITAGTGGSVAVSRLGNIGLRSNDPFFLKIAPLIHELAHELLHDLHARIERGAKGEGLMEAEAETTAAVVLRYFGHDSPVSASYLRNWGATPKVVLDSMNRIADAAGRIVNFVEERT